jgi:hypothetical protein
MGLCYLYSQMNSQSRFTLLASKLAGFGDVGVKRSDLDPGMSFIIEWESGVFMRVLCLPAPLPPLQVCARVTNLIIANKYMEQWENPDDETHPRMGFFLDECMDVSVIELADSDSFDAMLAQVVKLNEIRLAFERGE